MKIDIDTNLQPVQNPIEIKHKNYLEYLAVCWANHYGAVISPDILWHIVLCELAMEIAKRSEDYRDLFSDSSEKQEISVQTDDDVVLPIEKVIDILKTKCKINTSLFLPRFSTTGESEELAFGTAFLDLVSPYYEYSMFCCGIPYVKIFGTPGDYHIAVSMLDELSVEFSNFPPVANWLTSVADLFNKIEFTLLGKNDVNFKHFFALERCGSGSQVEVAGWINDLFLFDPPVRYVKNFNSCVSKIEYKNLSTNKEYQMTVALEESRLEGDLLIPNFKRVVAEKVSLPEPEKREFKDLYKKLRGDKVKSFRVLNGPKTGGYAVLDDRRILDCDFE